MTDKKRRGIFCLSFFVRISFPSLKPLHARQGDRSDSGETSTYTPQEAVRQLKHGGPAPL